MKIKLGLIILTTSLFVSFAASAQQTRILTKAEVIKMEKDEIGGPFPVIRAFQYCDNIGCQDLLLCEKKLKVIAKDTLNRQIAAICHMEDHGGYREMWSINDKINPDYDEASIWFWTKYCTATDLDGDKFIDPVIVYGSKDTDGNYRRIKIITVYKGKKYAIRAVESDLDYGRSFKKDVQFAALPAKNKNHLEKLLAKMRQEQGLLLKDG
jgi:hypothetical protein